ncbi:MAG: biliverdin-producing heme oxygenase [Firmicutes bacterium]|nr:biliverdin-producing heme oxygenase [Bacillota bacterium]
MPERHNSHDDLLAHLRQATSAPHQALERSALMRQLLQSSLSRERYIQVLTVFAQFYQQVDDCFRSASNLPNGYTYQPRLSWLLRDLNAMNAETQFDSGQPSWRHQFESATTNEQQAMLLGFAYVVEGSSQGAKIIAPKVAKLLKLTPSTGLAYFSAQADGPHAWPVLLKHLSQVTPTAEQCALSCHAATQLFEFLQHLVEHILDLNPLDEGSYLA